LANFPYKPNHEFHVHMQLCGQKNFQGANGIVANEKVKSEWLTELGNAKQLTEICIILGSIIG